MPEVTQSPVSSYDIKKNPNIYDTYAHLARDQEQVVAYLTSVYEQYAQKYAQSQLEKKTKNAAELIKEQASLPDHLLVYLMVEIRKMMSESHCFAFEAREPKCIEAFFRGLAETYRNNSNFELSHELIKKLHALVTDPKLVSMKQITMKDSGNYRDTNEILRLDSTLMSPDGLRFIINLIATGWIDSIELGNEKNFEIQEEYKFIQIR